MWITRLVSWFAFVGSLASCGVAWETESVPVQEDLRAVWGFSAEDLFVVGDHGTVLRRQDGQWRELLSGTEENLLGVWGSSPEHLVVVGENCTVLEFIGEPEELPEGEGGVPVFRPLSVQTCGDFHAIDGVQSDEALVVGRGVMQRYNGSGLTNIEECGDRMLGVSCQPGGESFAVGEGGDFCHYHDGSWHRREIFICPGGKLDNGECPTDRMPPVVWDVWVGKDGDGAAVGTYGGLWSYPFPEGYYWTALETDFSTELRSVHGWVDELAEKDRTTVFAVGTFGVVVSMRGQEATFEVSGTEQDLHGVWVAEDGKDIFAVGASGTVIHSTR